MVELVHSIEELLAPGDERLALTSEGKSGAVIERVTRADGTSSILKVQRPSDDWIMRALGDEGFWAWTVWSSGLTDRLPSAIDPAVQAMASYEADGERTLAVLMDDVAPWLVPDGDDPIDDGLQRSILAAMADLHVAFWESPIGDDLLSMAARLRFFAPDVLARFDRDDEPPVPVRLAHEGWQRLVDLEPSMASVLSAIHDDPAPLVDALASTPSTFLHGDWKLANLGRRPDGTVLLLDWALPGPGPGCWEIAWYLALNRARLPTSKEEAIATYRQALEDRGVDLHGWWDAQLELSLLGVAAVFGWEKALGDQQELGWWAEAVARARVRLP